MKKKDYDRIELTPYPTTLFVATTPKVFNRLVRQELEQEAPPDLPSRGVFIASVSRRDSTMKAVVWGYDLPGLVHEISHAILETFLHVGIDPREAAGEPFCYLMSHVLSEVTWDRLFLDEPPPEEKAG